MTSLHLPDGTFLQKGKYKITRFIGSGGFGCTYEAYHVMLEKKVAIKEFFVKDFCNRDETTSQISIGTQNKIELVKKLKKKFINEARALSVLHHPNIVSVTDVFEENGTAYFVMDYIDGSSLSEIIEQKKVLSEDQAIKYILQVAEALKYVHEHNRLHLDVKPGNIMIDKNNHAILIDFGTSKQYDEVNGENTSTIVGLTPGYAPPEQMSKIIKKFTPATDIYALGATLYKLLTGITPLESTLRISEDELVPLPKTISAETREAVEAALQLPRNRRPQSITAFLSILTKGKESEETEINNPEESEDTILNTPSQNHQTPLQQSEEDHTSKEKDTKYNNQRIRFSTKSWLLLFTVCIVTILIILFFPKIKNLFDTEQETIVYTTGTINGHEYVDLGLSVKWATCNIGAFAPSDGGDYFAWGETKPKDKYSKDNYSSIKVKEEIAGSSKYDAACVNWGSEWRLPTIEECQELIDSCSWEWTSMDKQPGYKVIGPNGKSIFLPATGFRDDEIHTGNGILGRIWCSIPHEDEIRAFCLNFSKNHYKINRELRIFGQNIRPVCNYTTVDSSASVSDIPVCNENTKEIIQEPTQETTQVISLLYVTSSPVGAIVYIDNKQIGTTPVEACEITRGRHSIRIEKDGYQLVAKQVQFSKNIEELNFNLSPAVSLLYVTTTPSGATIYVDDKQIGTTPINTYEILQGWHKFEIKKTGYVTIIEYNNINSSTFNLRKTLEPTPTDIINGHKYVDLGLSVKWATCNIGASSPSDYGNYYAWGETTTKATYLTNNSSTYEKKISEIKGDNRYDAARANWGNNWRLPTMQEFQELNSRCSWTWTTLEGRQGYKITGPNGNSIFLPAAGFILGSTLNEANADGTPWSSSPNETNSYGYYWTSTPNGEDTQYACRLYFSNDSHGLYWGSRSSGLCIRPVYP